MRVSPLDGAGIRNKYAAMREIITACEVSVQVLHVYAVLRFVVFPDIQVTVVCMVPPVTIGRAIVKGGDMNRVAALVEKFSYKKCRHARLV